MEDALVNCHGSNREHSGKGNGVTYFKCHIKSGWSRAKKKKKKLENGVGDKCVFEISVLPWVWY